MKLQPTICLFIVLFGGICGLMAQSSDPTPSEESADETLVQESKKEADTTAVSYLMRSAIGVAVGSPGFSGEYAHNLNRSLNVRLRGAYFNLRGYGVPYSIDGRNLDISASAEVLNVDLLLEFLPFQKSSFKLVGGLSYINNVGGDAVIFMADNVFFGEVELTPEDVGQLDIGLNYSGLAPYMGLGFGRSVPKKRVGVSLELGTYYMGPPDVRISATKLLEPTANEKQGQNLAEALDSFRWLPCALLKVAVRLN